MLKDASSAAVYGARGAFGVLLITTKRPKAGQFAINYGASYGTKQPTAVPQFVKLGDPLLGVFPRGDLCVATD